MSHSDGSLNNIDQSDHFRNYPNVVYDPKMTWQSVDIREFNEDTEQQCLRLEAKLKKFGLDSKASLVLPAGFKFERRKRTRDTSPDQPLDIYSFSEEEENPGNDKGVEDVAVEDLAVEDQGVAGVENRRVEEPSTSEQPQRVNLKNLTFFNAREYFAGCGIHM